MTAADTRISDATATLEAGVQSIIESADYQRLLSLVAKFHHYSINNTMLIYTQRPDASRVAGFRTWLTAGRAVRKGEKGIKIFVPHIRKPKDDDENAEPFVTFGIGHVFDVSQTDGEPLPEVPSPQLPTADAAAGFADAVTAFAVGHTITVHAAYAGYAGSPVRGSWSPTERVIRIASDATPIEAAKTLVHELAHALTPDTYEDRDQREAIAEGAAFVVCSHFGMATDSYSFPYITGYCSDVERFRATLAPVQSIAHTIIDGLADASRCPSCGHAAALADRFCQECGTPRGRTKVAPHGATFAVTASNGNVVIIAEQRPIAA
jgi:antirestriction protein ArdC